VSHPEIARLAQAWPAPDKPATVLEIEAVLDSGLVDWVEDLRRRVVSAVEELEARPGPSNTDALVAAHRLAEALGDAGRFLLRASDAVGEFADHYPDLEATPYEIEGEADGDEEEDEPE
jgi:hypothetical protein